MKPKKKPDPEAPAPAPVEPAALFVGVVDPAPIPTKTGADIRDVAVVDESPFQHRHVYPARELFELAHSIRWNGVKDDCLARPSPHDPTRLELAYGHRRRRASVLAVVIAMTGLTLPEYQRLLHVTAASPDFGKLDSLLTAALPLAVIPVIVRPMSDEEVMEEQGRENFQRAQPNALEVADYIDTLMKEREQGGLGYSIDQVLAKTRKERSWVVSHLKLLELAPDVRDDIYASELTEEYMFAIARISAPKLQRACLDLVLRKDRSRHNDDEPEILSLHDTRMLIKRRFMLTLKNAPFETGDAALVKGRPACGPCPERTGCQPGLFPDVADDSTCTNVLCFDMKARAAFAAEAAKLKIRMLPDAEADKLFQWGRLKYDSRYRSLSEAAPYEIDAKQKKNLSEVLKDRMPPLVRAWSEGKGHTLALKCDVEKAIRPLVEKAKTEKRSKAAVSRAPDADQREKAKAERRKRDIADAVFLRGVGEVATSWPKDPELEVLRELAEAILDAGWSNAFNRVADGLGIRPPPKEGEKVKRWHLMTSAEQRERAAQAEKATHTHLKGLATRREIMALIVAMVICRDAWNDGPKLLKVFAAATTVDLGNIEREVKASFNAIDAAKKTKAKPAPAAKGKAPAPAPAKSAAKKVAAAPPKVAAPAKGKGSMARAASKIAGTPGPSLVAAVREGFEGVMRARVGYHLTAGVRGIGPLRTSIDAEHRDGPQIPVTKAHVTRALVQMARAEDTLAEEQITDLGYFDTAAEAQELGLCGKPVGKQGAGPATFYCGRASGHDPRLACCVDMLADEAPPAPSSLPAAAPTAKRAAKKAVPKKPAKKAAPPPKKKPAPKAAKPAPKKKR